MSSKQEILAQWLRDAHAIEEQAKTMLTAQLERIQSYPQLKARIEQHLRESEGQEQRLRQRLDALGGTSMLKDMGGKLAATMQGLGGSVMPDEVVKGSAASYAFEHLEIATYRALIGAADACGDLETKRVAEQNLREEEEMAGWLEQNMPAITAEYLEREGRGEQSKR